MDNLNLNYNFINLVATDYSHLVNSAEPEMKKIIVYLFKNNILPRQIANAQIELSISFVDHTAMKLINQKWRNKAQSTDVLSMALDDIKDTVIQGFNYITLGDIIINLELLKSHDKNYHLKPQMLKLFIHGVLHIMGFDHNEPKEANIMHTLESELLSYISLSEEPLTSMYFMKNEQYD